MTAVHVIRRCCGVVHSAENQQHLIGVGGKLSRRRITGVSDDVAADCHYRRSAAAMFG